MLDINALHKQFAGFGQYQKQERDRKADLLQRAVDIYENYDVATFQPAEKPAGRPDALFAFPLEQPKAIYDPVERPQEITLVATDGSQIYPDRHVEPLCYLLNVGRIAFQYGTTEEPWMDAVPYLYFKGQDLDAESGIRMEVFGPDIVSAKRDELELRQLVELAKQVRIAGRPILAVADGTLVKWSLKKLQKPELEEELLGQFFEALEVLRDEAIPICSYISMPGSAEYVTYLAKHMSGVEVEEASVAGLADRVFFKDVLQPGQRTGVFESVSRVVELYPEDQKICYFYIHMPAGYDASEIARVEFPKWVANEPALLDLIQATLLSECKKGNGYPVILSEAHEHAIIRGPERTQFYMMIEQEMQKERLDIEQSSKKRSKDEARI